MQKMKLILEMKKRNNTFNLINNCSINNRAVYIIALFILSINFLFSQIEKLDTKCIWISREDMINKESIEKALLFAHESGFNKIFLQVRGRGD